MRVLAVWLAFAAGCSPPSSCVFDEVLVEISCDSRAQNANRVVVAATLGKNTKVFDLTKRAGSSHDALDIEFTDKEIPSYGDTLSLTVTAVQNSDVIGIGTAGKQVSPGCQSTDVSVTGISGSCSADSACGAGKCSTAGRCCYGDCP